jgi:hypothetical protein
MTDPQTAILRRVTRQDVRRRLLRHAQATRPANHNGSPVP